MYCKNCGSPIDKVDKFCTKCGTRLEASNVSMNPIPQKLSSMVPNEKMQIKNYYINIYKDKV